MTNEPFKPQLYYEIQTGTWFTRLEPQGMLKFFIKGCWAGRGKGKNDPTYTNVKGEPHKLDAGPLPKGFYMVMPPIAHERLGYYVLKLIPNEKNRMFGRGDFWIHGPSKDPKRYGEESLGCIIAARPFREKIWEFCKENNILGFEVI